MSTSDDYLLRMHAAEGENTPHLDTHAEEAQASSSAVVDDVLRAYEAGDFALAAVLLERDPVVIWYGIPPEKFGEMITVIARSGAAEGLFLNAGLALLFPDEATRLAPQSGDDAAQQEPLQAKQQLGKIAGELFSLRLQGKPVQAMKLTEQLQRASAPLQPLFDSSRGFAVFATLQAAITAMLAGDFVTALGGFAQTRMCVRVPALAFLHRDACAKAAILEGLYGDPRRARALLEEADTIPRTDSWIEEAIDVGQIIAASIVRAETPDAAIEMLEAVPMHAIGEVWPFYIVTMQRALIQAGRLGDAKQWLGQFERMPLPRVEGEGYVGSAFAISAAERSMMLGELEEAREQLARADGSLTITRLLLGTLELSAGRPREAIKHIAGMHEQTAPLRTLDLWRFAIIAGTQLALGETEECVQVLEAVMENSNGALGENEHLIFSSEVRQLAATRIAGWPPETEGDVSAHGYFSTRYESLTPREQDLLRELASGRSREQIASAQFISINTLKAHLRSIYRKLGVRSRPAAVLEGERRGFI